MDDRRLLELAAKAAGMGELVWGETYKLGDDLIDCSDLPYLRSNQPDEADVYWNPLTDDGDALRLAVRLQLHIGIYDAYASAASIGRPYDEKIVWFHNELDPGLATCRAIVRAAAAIGESMEVGR